MTTWAFRHVLPSTRERGRGTDFESFRTVVTALSPFFNNTPHIFVNSEIEQMGRVPRHRRRC